MSTKGKPGIGKRRNGVPARAEARSAHRQGSDHQRAHHQRGRRQRGDRKGGDRKPRGLRATSWIRDAVVYQIYTRSFLDTNGDGVGDFPGVTRKLDYLAELGVDVIWLSPFCDSPNHDNGYDVSNYRDVHRDFGTLDEFDELVARAHGLGIRIMMDLVLNHTSDEHPWFVESAASKDNPRRAWYHWAHGQGAAGELPPNNWDSYFGGPAWTRDERTGMWYLHHFSAKQPDLNWGNPDVRAEMHDIARFWIERGVDAFRLDAVHHIGKPEAYIDAPESGGRPGRTASPHFRSYCNLPATHDYLREMREAVFEPNGTPAVGETGGVTPRIAAEYVDERRRELDLIFRFDHVRFHGRPPAEIGRLFQQRYRSLGRRGWDAQFWSNHDLPRHLSVLGDDRWLPGKSAKLFAMLLLTSWGTPFIYQGEEVGMTNAHFHTVEEFRDPHALFHYRNALQKGEDPELCFGTLRRDCRDNARTPMQWSSDPEAGFTTGTPWIKTIQNYETINVAAQQKSSDSVLTFYRELAAVRRESPVLRRGDFRLLRLLPTGPGSHAPATRRRAPPAQTARQVPPANVIRFLVTALRRGVAALRGIRLSSRCRRDTLLCYTRRLGDERALVLLNWSDKTTSYRIPRRVRGKPWSAFTLRTGSYAQQPGGSSGETGPEKSTSDRSEVQDETRRQLPAAGDALARSIRLRPWEARLYQAGSG